MHHLRHTSSRYMGTEVIDGIETAQTVCCVHCRAHWTIEPLYARMANPGPKKVRGWCPHCRGPTCGTKHCESRGCEPMQKKIDKANARR